MAKRPDIPFSDIASQALSSIEILLNRWLPGGKYAGHEYKTTNPKRADAHIGSFSINVRTGAWGDFATDDSGGDLISLYAYLYDIKQNEAAIELADLIGFNLPEGCRPATKENTTRKKQVIDPATVKPKAVKEDLWEPVVPAPADAGDPPAGHFARGKRQEYWTYYDGAGNIIGYVYRYNTSVGEKETLPVVYCINKKSGAGEWRFKSFPTPRPLYGLDRLAARPEAWVLLVEGEKCADAPVEMLENAVVVSWPGGSKAVEKVDWTPLAGRNIYAWADCDFKREPLSKADKDAGMDPAGQPVLPESEQPGMKAMLSIQAQLLELDPTTKFKIVDIPLPGDKPDGWDVADAIAEGMEAETLKAFIRKTRSHLSAVPGGGKTAKSKTTAPKATAEEQEYKPTWRDYLLKKSSGEIVACLANVVDILENDPKWQSVIAFDEFAQRVMKLKKPPFWNDIGEVGEWDAQDDARTAMWITKMYRFSPSPALVGESIDMMSRSHTINPPRDWMESLVWDGVPRLKSWMLDYMGVPRSEYSERVATWFFMGMVKRVFEPGCKFDYCLVLEGPQGKKKSSALSIIGGAWYGDTDIDLHNKDSMSAIRGKMLYEFSELGGLAKAEEKKQKSFLSRQVDEYRPVYGRREIRVPRSGIFAGSTNEWEWNQDPTGGRRFWPALVTIEVDTEGLKAVRDQLFAEAVIRVKAGRRYWPTAEEQSKYFDPEQLKRSIPEGFVDALYDHVMAFQGHSFSLNHAATEWLKLLPKDLTKSITTRIGIALRQLGCDRVEERTNTLTRFLYKPPKIRDALSTTGAGKSIIGDDDEVF